MSARAGSPKGGWQVKRINSVTGPFDGTKMTDAIEKWNTNVTGQTTMLWSGPDSQDGTNSTSKYKITRKYHKEFILKMAGIT